MAISTYAELQTAVANWLARDDLTSRIPEFIALAEAKFNRDLRCIQMEKRSTATINLASSEPEYLSLPLDFQVMRRVRVSSVEGKPRLEFLVGAQAEEFREAIANVVGRPKYFTVFGDELELIPTPDEAYIIEMVYRANIPALASNSTNWLLTLAPDAYLYGGLMESAPYIKEDARVQTWAQGYGYAIDGLNRLSMDKTYGSGPLVVRSSHATP